MNEMKEIIKWPEYLPDTVKEIQNYMIFKRKQAQAFIKEIEAIEKMDLPPEQAKILKDRAFAKAQDAAKKSLGAEIELGRRFKEVEKSPPGPGKITPLKRSYLKKLKYPQQRASEAERMHTHKEKVGEMVDRKDEKEEIVLRRDTLRLIKEIERGKKRKEDIKRIGQLTTLEDVLKQKLKFKTITIDPGWDYGDEGDVDPCARSKPTYAVMTIDELKKYPIPMLTEENCHLYLWITNRSLPKGFVLLEKWGFRYITCLTWCKPSYGLGQYFRGSTEHVLFGIRGSLTIKRHDIGTWFEAPRGKVHSEKPEKFYMEIVERCSHGLFLEIFGRKKPVNRKESWIVIGAEIK